MTTEARPALPRLMLVTDRRRVHGADLVEAVVQAVAGGVGIVQVREKDLPQDALDELVRRVSEALPAAVAVVVNGSARVAAGRRVGLHLPAAPAGGPAPSRDCRPRGRSVHDEAAARRGAAEGADYLVFGHVFESASKPDLPPRGPEALRAVVRAAAGVPVYAIGGIVASRVPSAIRAGAWGVAVCGAILCSPHPRRVAEALSLALDVATRRA